MGRQTISQIAYAVGVGCGISRVVRWLNHHKLLILMYHGLHAGEVDPLENCDGLHVHVEQFVRQMQYLAKHCQVLPLESCLEQRPAPAYRAVVTFDDGYASVYRYAYPVLRALHLPATVFVPTDFIAAGTAMWWDRLRFAIRQTTAQTVTVPCGGQQRVLQLRTPHEKAAALQELAMALRMVSKATREAVLVALGVRLAPDTLAASPLTRPLTVAQMREMAAHGISFASHGRSHESFLTLSSAEIWREMCESKAQLEEWVEAGVTWLAYPFGDFDARTLELLPRAGYRGAVTTIDGLSHEENRFTLRRIAVGGQTTFPQFVAAVSGVRDAVGRVIRKRDQRLFP